MGASEQTTVAASAIAPAHASTRTFKPAPLRNGIDASIGAGMSPRRSGISQPADCHAGDAAEPDEHQALGHELPDQSRLRGPERAADGELAPAALGSNEHQARDVDAGDEQQQAGPAQQHEEDGPDVADNHVRQIDDAGALIPVRIGVLRLELLGDRLHLGTRCFDRDAVLEAAHASQVVAAPPRIATPSWPQRRPELHRAPRSELKILGQDADDGVRNGAEVDRLTDDVDAGAEALLPGGMAKDDARWCPRQVFAGVEIAAERGGDAERAKEPVAHARARHELRARGRPHHVAAAVVDVERAKHGVQPLPVEVVEI